MKFTVFALIAAFCIVAISANATGKYMTDSAEVEDLKNIAQDLDQEYMDIEPTGMYFVIKRALRTLKGLNCTIKEVLQIQTAAQNFVNGIQACGGEVSKKVQSLINACNDIIKTTEEILGINESICGNTVNDDDSVQTFGAVKDAKTAHNCFVKMVRKVNTLKKQIKYAVKLIKQIKKVPADSSQCVMDAVNTLENTFTQFPSNIKECSKLTS